MKEFDKFDEVFYELDSFNNIAQLTLEDVLTTNDSSIPAVLSQLNTESISISDALVYFHEDLIGIESLFLDPNNIAISPSKKQKEKNKDEEDWKIFQKIINKRSDRDVVSYLKDFIFDNKLDTLFYSNDVFKKLQNNEHKIVATKARAYLISYFSTFERFTFKSVKLADKMNFRVRKKIKDQFVKKTQKNTSEEFIQIIADGNITDFFHKAERDILNFLKTSFEIDGNRYKVSDIIKQIYDEHIILRQLRNMMVHRSMTFDSDFISEIREIIKPLNKNKVKKEEIYKLRDDWIYRLMENLNLTATIRNSPDLKEIDPDTDTTSKLDAFIGKNLILSPMLLLRSYLILYGIMFLFSLRIPGLNKKEKSNNKKDQWKDFNKKINLCVSNFIHDNLVLYDKTKHSEILHVLKTFLKLFDISEINKIYTPNDQFYHHSAMVYHELYLREKLATISEKKTLEFRLAMTIKIHGKESSKTKINGIIKKIKRNNRETFHQTKNRANDYKKKYLSNFKKIKSKTLRAILLNYFKADIPSVVENSILQSEKEGNQILPRHFEDSFEIRHLTDKHVVRDFLLSYRSLQKKISSIDTILEILNKKP